MPWHEVISELERKLEGTFEGTYRPVDNIPFFRVQYPPSEEREAISQFILLAERLSQKGRKTCCLFLTEILKEAMANLINCPVDELERHLINLEKGYDRIELQSKLTNYLPEEMIKIIKQKLQNFGRDEVLILLRMGALYPFIRPSSLLSRLEGQLNCVIILPYPGTTLGSILDTPPADPHRGYYRGEIISWK